MFKGWGSWLGIETPPGAETPQPDASEAAEGTKEETHSEVNKAENSEDENMPLKGLGGEHIPLIPRIQRL